jgi:mRNA interferase MazF
LAVFILAKPRVSIAGQEAKAMADQVMAADKGRLKGQLGTLGKRDMVAIEEAILVHPGMPK